MLNETFFTSFKKAQLARAGYSQFIQYAGSRIFALLHSQSVFALVQSLAGLVVMKLAEQAQLAPVRAVASEFTCSEPRGDGLAEQAQLLPVKVVASESTGSEHRGNGRAGRA